MRAVRAAVLCSLVSCLGARASVPSVGTVPIALPITYLETEVWGNVTNLPQHEMSFVPDSNLYDILDEHAIACKSGDVARQQGSAGTQDLLRVDLRKFSDMQANLTGNFRF